MVVDDVLFIVKLGIVIGFFGLNGVGKFIMMCLIVGFDCFIFGCVVVVGCEYCKLCVLLIEVGVLLDVKVVYIGCFVCNYFCVMVVIYGILVFCVDEVIDFVGIGFVVCKCVGKFFFGMGQ